MSADIYTCCGDPADGSSGGCCVGRPWGHVYVVEEGHPALAVQS